MDRRVLGKTEGVRAAIMSAQSTRQLDLFTWQKARL